MLLLKLHVNVSGDCGRSSLGRGGRWRRLAKYSLFPNGHNHFFIPPQSTPQRAHNELSTDMPTATMTTQDTIQHSSSVIPLKSAATSSMSSTATTLRSLYPRAAKAFLLRDVTLTHSLLLSAFGLLHPPISFAEDALVPHRRKWDILRITFETTLYVSPSTSDDPEALPASLRANQMLSPQSLVTQLHARSLLLFTPSAPLQKPNATFLPPQVLMTLVLASLKTGCPEIGRQMIEDWLSKRNPASSYQDLDGYTKIIELYTLQVLPALEEWDYASEFLQYEPELVQMFDK